MTAADKAKHAAEEMAGKVKEGFGKLTDNEKLEAEGKVDQAKANAKQAGDDVKDAAKKVRDGIDDALNG